MAFWGHFPIPHSEAKILNRHTITLSVGPFVVQSVSANYQLHRETWGGYPTDVLRVIARLVFLLRASLPAEVGNAARSRVGLRKVPIPLKS